MTKISKVDLKAITAILGDVENGLSTRELTDILVKCGFYIRFSKKGKLETLFQTLAIRQVKDGNRRAILAFLRTAMAPDTHKNNKMRFDALRSKLNDHLLFLKLEVTYDGKLRNTDTSIIDNGTKSIFRASFTMTTVAFCIAWILSAANAGMIWPKGLDFSILSILSLIGINIAASLVLFLAIILYEHTPETMRRIVGLVVRLGW